jgi:hypothetical protein
MGIKGELNNYFDYSFFFLFNIIKFRYILADKCYYFLAKLNFVTKNFKLFKVFDYFAVNIINIG